MNKEFKFNQSFQIESGRELESLTIAYSDYNETNAQKVIWVCHALSGNSEVMEWWSGLFGEGKMFDPSEYRIICANVIGSCYGSSSPKDFERPVDFPILTIKDIVKAHALLADELGLEKIDVLIGASLGGQQALEWSILQPNRFDKLILIATNAFHSPYARAFNEVQRLALQADSTYGQKGGGYSGLKAARAIAMLSYRSYEDFSLKQSESENRSDDFKAASYVRYQGEKFVSRFDPHSYFILTKAMDSHDILRNRNGNYDEVLKTISATTLVIGIDSDFLFPLSEQRLLADSIPKATLGIIESPFGHDSFLIDYEKLDKLISDFLKRDAELLNQHNNLNTNYKIEQQK